MMKFLFCLEFHCFWCRNFWKRGNLYKICFTKCCVNWEKIESRMSELYLNEAFLLFIVHIIVTYGQAFGNPEHKWKMRIWLKLVINYRCSYEKRDIILSSSCNPFWNFFDKNKLKIKQNQIIRNSLSHFLSLFTH